MDKRKPILLFGIIVLVLALTAMACNFSVDVPKVDAPAFPGNRNATPEQNVPPSDNVPPAQNVPPADQPALPEATSQNPNGAGQGNVIPGTGDNNGVPANPGTAAPQNLEQLYDQAHPGVVSILTQVDQGGQVGQGAGSGFVISQDGYIATNHHVIDGASTIIVRFYNDADIEARLVGDDPNSDLAIIKVDQMAEGVHPLNLGDSSKIAVGDAVVAIGNPFALGTSMSYGIISAVQRTIPSGFTPYNIPEAIQTDAAINPGNSGGPLINMRGEVIGINAQIRTADSGGGNVGIGFAIPVNILRQIYPSLIKNGSYTWPYLGVSSPAENPLSLSAGNQEQQRGALLASVEQGGPADQAGVREGDVVVAADGKQITSFDALLAYISYKQPGDQIQLTVLRNGKQQNFTVTLGARPKEVVPQQ